MSRHGARPRSLPGRWSSEDTPLWPCQRTYSTAQNIKAPQSPARANHMPTCSKTRSRRKQSTSAWIKTSSSTNCATATPICSVTFSQRYRRPIRLIGCGGLTKAPRHPAAEASPHRPLPKSGLVRCEARKPLVLFSGYGLVVVHLRSHSAEAIWVEGRVHGNLRFIVADVSNRYSVRVRAAAQFQRRRL